MGMPDVHAQQVKRDDTVMRTRIILQVVLMCVSVIMFILPHATHPIIVYRWAYIEAWALGMSIGLSMFRR